MQLGNWAVCLGITPFPVCIGYITKDEGEMLTIMYAERQHYPQEWWDKDFVKRFKTLKQAVKYYVEHSSYEEGTKRCLEEHEEKFRNLLKRLSKSSVRR